MLVDKLGGLECGATCRSKLASAIWSARIVVHLVQIIITNQTTFTRGRWSQPCTVMGLMGRLTVKMRTMAPRFVRWGRF